MMVAGGEHQKTRLAMATTMFFDKTIKDKNEKGKEIGLEFGRSSPAYPVCCQLDE